MSKPLEVLIVEDSKIDSALVIDELKQGGLEVAAKRVETPEEYKEALYKQQWDIIVSDYSMPRFNALAALHILQESGFGIPFIIISGSIGEELAVQALKKGADDYLMKDNLARLVPAIERELREKEERQIRKKVEGLLKETENSYRRLVEGVRDYGIFMLDPQGQVITWNLGAERTFGYRAEEILGKPYAKFYVEKEVQEGKPDNELKTALTKGQHEIENLRVRKDGNTFYAHIALTPVYNEQSVLTGFSVVTRDITEHKRAEEAIRKLTEDLELKVKKRTAQLELVNHELESFAHSVSHDLRAPLRNLISLCKILLSRYTEHLDDEGKDYLAFILESSQKMMRLTTDLLNLSRVTQAELNTKPVNLSEVAKEIMKEMKEDYPERHVKFDIMDNLIVKGDVALLRIALQNLLDNAWKFTGKRSDALVELGVMQKDNQKVYYIRDNGVGFDPEYKDKLFAPFQRLHSEEEFPGSGVGLATVQRIIHRHGGRVWAEGAVNQGATIYFTL